jgi:hypothetical protein
VNREVVKDVKKVTKKTVKKQEQKRQECVEVPTVSYYYTYDPCGCYSSCCCG